MCNGIRNIYATKTCASVEGVSPYVGNGIRDAYTTKLSTVRKITKSDSFQALRQTYFFQKLQPFEPVTRKLTEILRDYYLTQVVRYIEDSLIIFVGGSCRVGGVARNISFFYRKLQSHKSVKRCSDILRVFRNIHYSH